MQISKNNPFYFITSVTHNRLPVFRTDKLKQILAQAFDEARRSSGISLFTYAIMYDHYHIVTGNERNQSDTLRYFNGISARRVIGYLKDNDLKASLDKLRTETKKREYKHSLWEHHSNTFEIKTETVLMQKVNYIHFNPVQDGLADKPEEYLYSSARIWTSCPIEDEPLDMDIRKIDWRKS
ncbi:MAG: transposase [Pyrinomonadaceae bacterium]